MAHLHNFAKQTGVVMGQIGQKVKQVAQIGGEMKQIYDLGMFFKNVMSVAAPIAAVAL